MKREFHSQLLLQELWVFPKKESGYLQGSRFLVHLKKTLEVSF